MSLIITDSKLSGNINKLLYNENLKIFLVNGQELRKTLIEFSDGGHHYIYGKIPENEIWIDNVFKDKMIDLHCIIFHEIIERYIMKYFNFSYNEAHEFSNSCEKHLRKTI